VGLRWEAAARRRRLCARPSWGIDRGSLVGQRRRRFRYVAAANGWRLDALYLIAGSWNLTLPTRHAMRPDLEVEIVFMPR
jgi:hypothetical protein